MGGFTRAVYAPPLGANPNGVETPIYLEGNKKALLHADTVVSVVKKDVVALLNERRTLPKL